MKYETFLDAVTMAEKYSTHITLGGGEPLMHPKIMKMLEYLSHRTWVEGVLIVTNGKCTEKAWKVIDFIEGSHTEKHSKFSMSLSQDRFHEPVSPVLVKFFRGRMKSSYDTDYLFHIHENLSGRIMNVGRAKKNGIGNEDGCPCDGLVVQPDGGIYPCGCEGVPKIGHVADGTLSPDVVAMLYSEEYMYNECWTSYIKKTEDAHGYAVCQTIKK